jgi:hypothetical protein
MYWAFPQLVFPDCKQEALAVPAIYTLVYYLRWMLVALKGRLFILPSNIRLYIFNALAGERTQELLVCFLSFYHWAVAAPHVRVHIIKLLWLFTLSFSCWSFPSFKYVMITLLALNK